MKLKFFRGRKHLKDVVSVYVCSCGKRNMPTFKDIVTLAVLVARNEDLIYPKSRGFQGGDMFYQMLMECVRDRKLPTISILQKYQLDSRCCYEDRRF